MIAIGQTDPSVAAYRGGQEGFPVGRRIGKRKYSNKTRPMRGALRIYTEEMVLLFVEVDEGVGFNGSRERWIR